MDHLISFLDPAGRILLITLEYIQNQMAGPPYSVSAKEIESLFATKNSLKLLETNDILDDRNKGLTQLLEHVFDNKNIIFKTSLHGCTLLPKNHAIVIPARYSSSRFPGKPLADIAGKPMIQHVWESVKQTPSIDQILVATDDERILDTVRNFGGDGVLTSKEHETGTDRIVEVAQEISCEWVLNIQGDEPTVLPADLDRLIRQAKIRKGTKAATLIYNISDHNQLNDPNIVKVTL